MTYLLEATAYLIKQIHPKLQIPIAALGLVIVVKFFLSLINIGSTVAFNAIISLFTMAIYLPYILPIYHLLVLKVQRRHPRHGPSNSAVG